VGLHHTDDRLLASITSVGEDVDTGLHKGVHEGLDSVICLHQLCQVTERPVVEGGVRVEQGVLLVRRVVALSAGQVPDHGVAVLQADERIRNPGLGVHLHEPTPCGDDVLGGD